LAYRETEHTLVKKADTHLRLLKAARRLVQQGDFAADKLTAAVETVAQRALVGRTLAYALIAEPVDPRVEQERLRFRFAYAEIFEDVIALGIQRGEFVAQNCQITAAALVGMLAESLVGPLKKEHEHEHDDLVHSLTALVLRAVGFNA
jgi:hypothetical protein